MNRIFFLKGLPGSGKTTWAKEYVRSHPGAKRINKDDLREMLNDGVFSRDNENSVLKARNHLAALYLKEGCDVIIDDTNFHPKHREYFATLAIEFGAEFEEKYFETSLEKCI
ncbi:MAG: AAA family ATPase, partial [Nitrospiria bacterium]